MRWYSYSKTSGRVRVPLNGRQKRIFIAAVCEKLCDGSTRKTEERFEWGREAIAKELLERSSEPEEEVRLPRGGVKPSKVWNPQLAIDIRLIVEPHTHSDPELKSTRLYTNFSAAEVRSALSAMGYNKGQLPSERTLRDILNRMNYRLKRIQKGKPLKKTENTTPIFENLAAARDYAKDDPLTSSSPIAIWAVLEQIKLRNNGIQGRVRVFVKRFRPTFT